MGQISNQFGRLQAFIIMSGVTSAEQLVGWLSLNELWSQCFETSFAHI